MGSLVALLIADRSVRGVTMRHGASRIGLAIVAATLSGCGADSQPTVTVADSAGVEIVTNLPGSLEAAEAWSLSAEPVIEIGAGADPEVALFRITDVVALEGGRVAVGTNTPPQVRIFESDGTLAVTLGREGEGPGEFSSVGSVVPLGADSIAVWDADRRRMSVFTVVGQHGREADLSATAPLTAAAAPSTRTDAGFTHLLASSPGSLFLFAEGVFSSRSDPGVRRPELPAYRITTEGEEVARLGPFPGMEMFFGGALGQMPLPLGTRTYATALHGALVVGTADVTEFRMYAPTGDLERIVRWPDHDRGVGGRFLSRWSEMVDSQPRMREMMQSIPRPERFPAYEGLVSTDAGKILVEDYAGPLGILPLRRADHGPEAFRPVRRIPERRWLVFDADGALAASVVMPAGFEPYAVRDGLVWGVFTDELDVESVRAYRLSKP